MTVTVKRIGDDLTIMIPERTARRLKLSKGALLAVHVSGRGIVLQPEKRLARRHLAAIVAQIDRVSYRRRNREILVDRDVGQEIR
jgi:antitoxin component of MazEF toxin-antitoxin module